MARPTLAELTENFSLFDDWEGRYAYLIDLGRDLPAMDDALKTPGSEVKGCVSKVWLVATQDAGGRFHFIADSNGDITKGLIAILLAAYEGKTADEIAGVDIEGAFREIGLDEHLSPNRRNGFFAMVKRVRTLGA